MTREEHGDHVGLMHDNEDGTVLGASVRCSRVAAASIEEEKLEKGGSSRPWGGDRPVMAISSS